ncbi:hypothetical protein PV332_02060 [Streptomyces scabiei]|nr:MULTISPECIES: hypothetical protein [Streptomyces]MDW8473700.1 hypothetical protein [Streptomyces scabiei]MDX2538308.1 hypothetical protein [Streptomyces scabiei]MDX2570675.1 hypothetical protein [Streptomyces scabiei]MDX2574288.1 hypothetical protein [Streptomyces scabiei]MDX2653855.1 hypothetical protein [Streptomyces scabiei]
MSRTTRMPRRALTALALLSGAVLLAATACSADAETGSQRPPVRTAEASPARTTSAADSGEGDEAAVSEVSVDAAPDLEMADRIVLRRDGTRGSASMEFGKAKKGDGKALSVGAQCEGKGEIEVSLRPMGASFTVACRDGEVSGEYNQFAVEDADRGGTVTVDAPSTVRWSLSVGRGEPAEHDLDD